MNPIEQIEFLKSEGKVPVILAPMAGVTDAPFRDVVASFGATAVVSEMISSEALVRNSSKTFRRLPTTLEQSAPTARVAPRVFTQIMGSDPKHMAESAAINEQLGAEAIDINMGCPARKIVSNDSGSALMRDEDLAVEIAKAVVNAVKIPVSLKMRLGWDSEHINCFSLARKFEDVGVKMLTIHCRTRNQMYSGKADWSAIAKMRSIIKIPYVCNGDIKTSEDAITALQQSGASAMMIGRAALGKPWLLAQMMQYLNERSDDKDFSKSSAILTLSLEEQYNIIMQHFHATLNFYGELHGVKVFRKHFCWYSSGMKEASAFRECINKIEDVHSVEQCVLKFYESHFARC